jgi:hypothetical protein
LLVEFIQLSAQLAEGNAPAFFRLFVQLGNAQPIRQRPVHLGDSLLPAFVMGRAGTVTKLEFLIQGIADFR